MTITDVILKALNESENVSPGARALHIETRISEFMAKVFVDTDPELHDKLLDLFDRIFVSKNES